MPSYQERRDAIRTASQAEVSKAYDADRASKLRGRKIVKEKAGFAALSDAAKQAALDAADEEAMVRRRQKQQDVDSKRNAILDDEAVLLKAVDDEEKKEKLALLENAKGKKRAREEEEENGDDDGLSEEKNEMKKALRKRMGPMILQMEQDILMYGVESVKKWELDEFAGKVTKPEELQKYLTGDGGEVEQKAFAADDDGDDLEFVMDPDESEVEEEEEFDTSWIVADSKEVGDVEGDDEEDEEVGDEGLEEEDIDEEDSDEDDSDEDDSDEEMA